MTFLIRDPRSGQQFVFALTLTLDAAHVAYVAGIIETLKPDPQLEPLPYDPRSLGLIGRHCLLTTVGDRPLGIDRLVTDPQLVA